MTSVRGSASTMTNRCRRPRPSAPAKRPRPLGEGHRQVVQELVGQDHPTDRRRELLTHQGTGEQLLQCATGRW